MWSDQITRYISGRGKKEKSSYWNPRPVPEPLHFIMNEEKNSCVVTGVEEAYNMSWWWGIRQYDCSTYRGKGERHAQAILHDKCTGDAVTWIWMSNSILYLGFWAGLYSSHWSPLPVFTVLVPEQVKLKLVHAPCLSYNRAFDCGADSLRLLRSIGVKEISSSGQSTAAPLANDRAQFISTRSGGNDI